MRAIEEDLENLEHKLESRDTVIREMTTELDDLKSQLRNSEGQSNFEVIDMVLVKYITKKHKRLCLECFQHSFYQIYSCLFCYNI